jgi:hypothetical protein
MKKFLLINIVLLISIFNAYNCHSSLGKLLKQSWRWRSYDVNDGLPSKNIYNLIVTPKGSIWAVTGKGLCYFNNYYWVTVGAGQNFNKPWLKVKHDQNDGIFCIDYSYKMYHFTNTKIDSFDFKYHNKHINIIDVAVRAGNKILFTGFYYNDPDAYMFQKFEDKITLIENSKISLFKKNINSSKLISSNNYGVYLVKDSILKFVNNNSKVIYTNPNYDYSEF